MRTIISLLPLRKIAVALSLAGDASATRDVIAEHAEDLSPPEILAMGNVAKERWAAMDRIKNIAEKLSAEWFERERPSIVDVVPLVDQRRPAPLWDSSHRGSSISMTV